MTIQILHFVYILCSVQIASFTDADDNSSSNIMCGIPPCRAGCYYKETTVNGSQIGSCVIAPAGYYSPGDEMLYPCPKGTYASVNGSDICIVCPIGTSAPLEGSDACSPCDEGLYASEPGLVECNKCNPSKYFGSGSISFIRENGTDYCVDPKDAASECGNSTSPCSGRCYIAGNISMEADFSMRFCSIVPKGYYSPHDDELLYECPVGMYSLEGSNECTLCSPGSAASFPGSGSCLPCPESTYVSIFGASTCLDCNSSLYSGLGSVSTFYDDKNNISYCLKPSQLTFEYPSNEPTHDNSMSPSLAPKSTSPLSQPPTRGVVEITIHPTSIFDVIAESTRSPQRQDDSSSDTRSSSPNQVVFNDTSARTDQSKEIPKYLRFVIFFVVMLLMLISISYRWCYRRRPMCCRRRKQQQPHGRRYDEQPTIIRTKTFARTPPVDVILPSTDSDDEGMPTSPTFPVPKIISTTKIISKKSSSIDEDEESELGVYIEDGSVM